MNFDIDMDIDMDMDMKKLILMMVVITVAACSRLQVTSDWDTSVDFTPMRSYVLLPNETPGLSPFALQRIEAAIHGDLQSKGLRQVSEEAREYFGPKVYRSTIPRNVRLAEAPSFGQPIVLYDVLSSGAQAYLSLAHEVIDRRTRAEVAVAAGASS